jgi:hypothetical protein
MRQRDKRSGGKDFFAAWPRPPDSGQGIFSGRRPPVLNPPGSFAYFMRMRLGNRVDSIFGGVPEACATAGFA